MVIVVPRPDKKTCFLHACSDLYLHILLRTLWGPPLFLLRVLPMLCSVLYRSYLLFPAPVFTTRCCSALSLSVKLMLEFLIIQNLFCVGNTNGIILNLPFQLLSFVFLFDFFVQEIFWLKKRSPQPRPSSIALPSSLGCGNE
jgi:hypothetical protein